jgi:hypothetical protein
MLIEGLEPNCERKAYLLVHLPDSGGKMEVLAAFVLMECATEQGEVLSKGFTLFFKESQAFGHVTRSDVPEVVNHRIPLE